MKRKANELYQVEHYLNTTYSNIGVCVGFPDRARARHASLARVTRVKSQV